MTNWINQQKRRAKACRKTRATGKGPERGKDFFGLLFGYFASKVNGAALLSTLKKQPTAKN